MVVQRGRARRFLLATCDGAGSLQPLRGLIEALARRGHEIFVIAHDVQRGPIEASGGRFIGYDSAAQWDQGDPAWLQEDLTTLLARFGQGSLVDIMAAGDRLDPAALLVDCMLGAVLKASKQRGRKTVALMHAVYSFWCTLLDGAFRGPIDDADLALGFSYSAFDVGAAFPPNLHFVGPARPSVPDEQWRRRWPAKPLVVASLSTAIQSHPPGLQAGLLQRICDALAALDVEAVVSTGRGIDPVEMSIGANTAVERYVPHEAVLPGADLFITHAGHGSVMAGLSCGAPMLCLPYDADQPLNAVKVAELGLGEVLPTTASTDAILLAAAGMLANDALKARSAAFAAVVARAPKIERGVELIEALAA
jgi:UDP:flavonoid glycosyltransferase YjiC (YdhE family)